jgi:hypothetical protein
MVISLREVRQKKRKKRLVIKGKDQEGFNYLGMPQSKSIAQRLLLKTL